MDNEIKKQNMIPGSCDEFTRPEEIKELAKYLKRVKKDLEDRTTLNGDNLEIRGRKFMQGIDSLPDKLEVLSPDNEGVSSLVSSKEWLDADKNLEALGNRAEEIPGEAETGRENLNPDYEGIPGQQKSIDALERIREAIMGEHTDPEELSKLKEKIGGDIKETDNLLQEKVSMRKGNEPIEELSNYIEDLETPNNKNLELEDHKELIGRDEDKKIHRLEDHKELVGGNIESHDLEDQRVGIVGQPDEIEKLPTPKETIEGNENVDLSDYKEDLNDEREPKLENHKEALEGPGDHELSDYRENLVGVNEDSKLEDHKETLDDDRKPELSNYREDLEDSRESKLEDYKERLEDNRTNSLSDYRENLEDNREPELSDYRDNLDDQRENELSDHKETLDDDRKPELSNYREDLEDNRENELEDHRESLKDERENELSDHRELLEDSREPKLSDYREDLEDNRENKLEDHRELLEDNRLPELSDYREDLEDTKETELSNYIEDLGGDPEDHDLENERLNLTDDRENALENTKIGFKDTPEDHDLEDTIIRPRNTPEEVESLEDFIDSIADDREPELPDQKIGRPGDNAGTEWTDETGLYDATVERPEGDKWNGENLEDERLDLTDDRENELHDESTRMSEEDHGDGWDGALEDERIDLTDERENELHDESTRISEDSQNKVGWNEELEDERLDLTDDRENALEDEQIERPEGDKWDETLEDFIDSLEGPEDKELYDESTRMSEEDHGDGWSGSLEDEKLNRPDDAGDSEWTDETGLYDANLQRPGDEVWDETLEDHKEELEGPEDVDLEDHKEILEDERTPELKDYREEAVEDDPSKKNHKMFNSDEDWGKDDYSTPQKRSEDDDTKNGHKAFNPDKDQLENILNNRKDLSVYYTNLLHFADSKTLNKGWSKKVQGLISAYLSGNDISKAKAEEFERQLYSSIINDQEDQPDSHGFVKVPRYKLGKFNLFGNGLSPSAYLRWIAEETIGQIHMHGNLRALLMDETLGLLIYARDMLEKATNSNRDRLPGNSIAGGILAAGMQGGLAGAAKAAVTAGAKALLGGGGPDMSLPNNRPDEKEPTREWIALNEKSEENPKNRIANKDLVGGKEYNFEYNYINDRKNERFKGFQTTADELMGIDKAYLKTVEDLYAVIKAAPYMASADKVVSSINNPLRVSTLDSNCHWEIIFTPFVGTENGNVSYLPPITEINTWNKTYHGVETQYGTWIPINAFELSKGKMTSKTLALFDGEISYPVSMEFTNELRLTFVDDQYKSWRTYFERCMDCAIYNSQLHEKSDYDDDAKMLEWELDDYKNEKDDSMFSGVKNIVKSIKSLSKAKNALTGGGSDSSGTLTAIDKAYQCVAPYKNITFRCTIYSLTPQLSTVSKYDLLVVLKDFVEERSGDIDGDPGDLTVSFSIVGENPKDDRKKPKPVDYKKFKENYNGDKWRQGQGAASIIGNSVSKVIGVL